MLLGMLAPYRDVGVFAPDDATAGQVQDCLAEVFTLNGIVQVILGAASPRTPEVVCYWQKINEGQPDEYKTLRPMRMRKWWGF